MRKDAFYINLNLGGRRRVLAKYCKKNKGTYPLMKPEEYILWTFREIIRA